MAVSAVCNGGDEAPCAEQQRDQNQYRTQTVGGRGAPLPPMA